MVFQLVVDVRDAFTDEVIFALANAASEMYRRHLHHIDGQTVINVLLNSSNSFLPQFTLGNSLMSVFKMEEHQSTRHAAVSLAFDEQCIFDDSVRKGLSWSVEIARRLGVRHVTNDHLFLAMLEVDNNLGAFMSRAFNTRLEVMRQALAAKYGKEAALLTPDDREYAILLTFEDLNWKVMNEFMKSHIPPRWKLVDYIHALREILLPVRRPGPKIVRRGHVARCNEDRGEGGHSE